jgi:hypothetical protein
VCRCVFNRWLEIGWPLFTNYRVEVFSETEHILVVSVVSRTRAGKEMDMESIPTLGMPRRRMLDAAGPAVNP